MTVLDASAVLAWMYQQNGSERVRAALPGAQLSAVNLAEVLAKVAEAGGDPSATARDLGALGVTVHPLSAEDAVRSGALRPLTRGAGLSLGDRACLALATRLGMGVLSADRAWVGVDVGVEIEVLR